MNRILHSTVLFMLAAVVMTGCSSKEKENLEKFAKAQALFDNVKKYAAQGKFDEANADFCQARDILSDIRRKSGPMKMGDYELPEGPRLNGRTARQWQDQWMQELKTTLESNFDAYVEMSSRSKLDWNRARGFISTYGDKQLEDQWRVAFSDIDRARGSSAADFYLFECESAQLQNCEMIRLIIAPKLAKQLSTEKNLSSEGRKAAFGIIQVTVELDWQMYNRTEAADPTRGESASIPSRAYLNITVKTNRGRSSWDGEKRVIADAELPPALSSSAALEMKAKTMVKLQQKIEQQLASFEDQTLMP